MRLLVAFYTKALLKRDQFNTLITSGKVILVLCHTKVVYHNSL